MFGKKSREIAAQRAEIARLTQQQSEIMPYVEVAKELADKAKNLADPDSGVSVAERADQYVRAMESGFASYLAKELRGAPYGERVDLMQRLVGREALLEIFKGPLKDASKETIVGLLGGTSLGEAVEIYSTLAGPGALKELLDEGMTEQVALLTNPLDLEATRRYSEMCGNIATDQWRLGNVVRFNFHSGDKSVDPGEIVRSLTVDVTPYKKRAVLEVMQDASPSQNDQEQPTYYPLREGSLIVVGSFARGEGSEKFRPQIRIGNKLAYAYADAKKGSTREYAERLAYVEMRNHATGKFEIVHGKMPETKE